MEDVESSTPCNTKVKPFKLDFSLPFSEAIHNLKTSKGRKIVVGSDNYHVLAALFNGKTIDDYENVPLNYDGRRVNNIKSRISSLRHTYGIEIESQYKEGANYVEYWIARGDNV